MAYVITQNCCKDASCVPVCPVDCIRPVGGDGGFTGTEMLYIDPEACIDCGACLEECPVDAIHYDEDLPESLERFKEINATYFERHPLEAEASPPHLQHSAVPPGTLRVAVVGAGPAACYAAAELIAIDGVEVDMFERLPTPYGLIRAGVAPDHQHTKSVIGLFDHVFSSERFGTHFNVEIGRQVGHSDLIAHHHAVIYAVGASRSRDLGIPGEQLPGSHAAADFVGWYNGHPDHARHHFDLSMQRAVIVGNGNVALDVARVLLMAADQLATTDAARHALDALSDSHINEVVILGRRGPRHAAFSAAEFLALGYLDGVDIIIDEGELDTPSEDDDVETRLKLDLIREYAARPTTPGNKRIIFRFQTSPTEVVGDGRVEGLRVSRNATGERGGLLLAGPVADTELIETSLILRSIGYHGAAIDGVPYDPSRGIVPNDDGRVVDENQKPLPGVYVAGWIKRGPRGVIGTNRTCAHESVAALLADFDAGILAHEVSDRDALLAALADRGAEPVTWTGWRAIDAVERTRGAAESRPRDKFVSIDDMLAAARG